MKSSLSEIDDKLKQVAKELNGKLIDTKGKGMWVPHGYEERTLSWTKENLQYSIQIFPTIKNDKIKKWTLNASCYIDIDRKRYMKQKLLIENKKKDKLIENLDRLIEEAKIFLTDLTVTDLEFGLNYLLTQMVRFRNHEALQIIFPKCHHQCLPSQFRIFTCSDRISFRFIEG